MREPKIKVKKKVTQPVAVEVTEVVVQKEKIIFKPVFHKPINDKMLWVANDEDFISVASPLARTFTDIEVDSEDLDKWERPVNLKPRLEKLVTEALPNKTLEETIVIAERGLWMLGFVTEETVILRENKLTLLVQDALRRYKNVNKE